MFGRTEIFLSAVTLFSCLTVFTDLLKGKIYNWLTYPAILVGLAYGIYSGNIADSLLGTVLGLLCFGWIFLKGMMGGGDLKLLMAFGAWGGSAYVLKTALLSILVGGVLSAILLLQKKKLASFMTKLRLWFASVVVKELRDARPEVDRSLTMPFGIPLAIAAVWVAWADPFTRGWL